MGQFKNLVGKRFGKLLVIEHNGVYVFPCGVKTQTWKCKCDCGNEKIIKSRELKSGDTKSCGCIRKEKPNSQKHGKSNSRLYIAWTNMKSRCYNYKNKDYKHYGEKGITVCDEWLNQFQTFYDWSMKNGYREDLTIDRIDNSKGYNPNNCRWVTIKEQLNNYSKNHLVNYKGQQYTIKQLSEKINIPERTLRYRIINNWEENELSLPPKNNNKTIRKRGK